MEKERNNLVTANEVLTTTQSPLMTNGDVPKNLPPDLPQAISEATVTSSMASETIWPKLEEKKERMTPSLINCSKMESISDTSWSDDHQNDDGTPKLQRAKQLMTKISRLSLDCIDPDATALRCEGMCLIEELSKEDQFIWAREKLLRICISSIFALPSVDTLHSPDGEKTNVKALYGQTMEALETSLKCLLSKRPNTTELLVLLRHLAPWLSSGEVHERARAMNIYISLLEFAAIDPMFCIADEFPGLGLLIGELCLHIYDPDMTIGSQAMEGIDFLYSLVQRQKDVDMKIDSVSEEQLQTYKENLGTCLPLRSGQNISQIMGEFEPFLTSRQMTEILLTALGCLKECNRSTTAASYTITRVILEQYKYKLYEQIPEIIAKIYQQLGFVYQFQGRQIMLRVMSCLAHAYTQDVCSALLQCPFPMDRFATEMWYVLTRTCSYDELTAIVQLLLKKLQLNPKATGNYITPLAAASAFTKVLSVPRCSDMALYIYPRLLMALLVQVHYVIRHETERDAVSQDECEPVSYVVKALKTLLLAVRCFWEFAYVEKEGGWELLTSCEDHHRGVGLLAKAMLHKSYSYDLVRILYLLVPFLERGDEEHQITAMAFFVELLVIPEAKRLPEKYSLSRLKRGLANENAVIRSLCIKGLVSMAGWQGKEIQILLPVMAKGLPGMDGRLFLETVTEIEKILKGPEGADCICNITLSLQELFSDETESLRASAIFLFGRMVTLAKKNKKLSMRQQVLESIVPLLLHLQEENSDITKKCRYTLDESIQFLGWKLPKQVLSNKAWYEHEEVLDETCQYLVQKQQGTLQRFLYQGLFYTESPLLSIRRASVMFLGFLVLHMDSSAQKVELDIINNALERLIHDPEESVCIAAAHAHERVSAILSNQTTRPDGTSKTVASNTNEKQIRNSGPQSAPTVHSSCNFLGIIGLWKSASRK